MLAGALGAIGFAGALQSIEIAVSGRVAAGGPAGWAALALLTGAVLLLLRPRPSREAELFQLATNPRLLPFVAAGGMATHIAPSVLPGLPAAFGLGFWLLGLGIQGFAAFRMSVAFLDARERADALSPLTLVPFAGFLAAPISGAPLGLPLVALGLYAVGAIGCFAILLPLVQKLARGPDDPTARALRPLAFILISPPALGYLGLAAASGQAMLPGALVNLVLAAAVFVFVAPRLTAAPYSILWFAATFPCASLAKGIAVAALAAGHQMAALAALIPLGVCAIGLVIGVQGLWAALRGRPLSPN